MAEGSLYSDSFWEASIWSKRKQFSLYPYDSVVSFVYRSFPRIKPRSKVNILEIGCGSGNNLWFVAREGFSASGIDISQSAISFATKRFLSENLKADLRVGSFLELPWPSSSIDICIDRAATACVGISDQVTTINEVKRVLRPGGFFFFNGYSDEHTSAHHGNKLTDGRIGDITKGSLQGFGGIGFLSEQDVQSLFEDGWQLNSLELMKSVDRCSPSNDLHAEWKVVAKKL